MRILVAAVGALAVAGCAASPAPHAAASPGGQVPAPRPIVAEATPAGNTQGPDQEPKYEHETRQVNRAWGWVALSVSADALILATVTSFMMLHENSVRSSGCVDKVCSADGLAANDKLGALGPWNAVAWGVAAVGAGVGVFVLVTNPTDKALGTQIEVGPTASGLLLRGSF
jgi:hypothetical protein